MEYETDPQGYEDDRGYNNERDNRSRSPRADVRGGGESRARSASPNGRDRMDTRGPTIQAPPDEDDEETRNSGSNLFVTGIHPRLSEQDVARLFEKYGEVEKCNIMRDPHSRESRGFGFVNMSTAQQADAAREALQGEVYEGRTLSIEKARRSKPRTPTPGKYFGPPKRELDDIRGPPRGGGRYGDRLDDRRGGYGRREDPYSYRGSRGYGGDRYDDRGYGGGGGGGRRDRDDYAPRIDRYASGGRDDRYGSRGDSRRGGGDYYERGSGGRSADAAPYAEPPAASKEYGGSRSYDDRGEDRYSRR